MSGVFMSQTKLTVLVLATLSAMYISHTALADHLQPDGMGGFFTNDGHIQSDGMGGYYTPNGHIKPDGHSDYFEQ